MTTYKSLPFIFGKVVHQAVNINGQRLTFWMDRRTTEHIFVRPSKRFRSFLEKQDMIFKGNSKLHIIKPLRYAIQKVSLAVIWACVYRESGYWTAAANAINLSYPAL